MVSVLLVSTYDMGRQPFGLASPAAWLEEAGIEVVCADLSRERLKSEAIQRASLVGFFLPMHTATRMALPVIDRVRRVNPEATLVAYGLYAPLNADLLRERGVQHILGGEFEQDLRDISLQCLTSGGGLSRHPGVAAAHEAPELPAESRDTSTSLSVVLSPSKDELRLPRLEFRVPSRAKLLPLARYVSLQAGETRKTTGYTEASRGCKHRCRHCPIVPVYDGRFRIVPVDVVLADVGAQVTDGAQHITFGDPDFFNGIGHARAVLEGFGRAFPGVTYDVTIKVEHLLKHADAIPLLRDTGCAFVTTAVEAVDDEVLRRLEKGHTRVDFERAVELCASAGVPLSPTFVAFTPWTTVAGYLDLLRTIARLGLVEHVAPIQLAIRLLITQGSRLLELPDVRALAPRFDPVSLTYPWKHPDAAVDALHAEVSTIVGVRLNAPRAEVFARIWQAAHSQAGGVLPELPPQTARAAIPYLTEPWYC